MQELLNMRTDLQLALSRQNLQGLQVRQALKLVEQHPIVSHYLLVRLALLLLRRLHLFALLRLPEHLSGRRRPGEKRNHSISPEEWKASPSPPPETAWSSWS